MRIAWFGPTPADDGGVPYAAAVILGGLVARGHEVDCYLAGPEFDLPDMLLNRPGLNVIAEPLRWGWNRWYSRKALAAFITAQLARARAQRRLTKQFVDHHARASYDVIYLFSQIELLALRSVQKLPPLVVHPEVHAAGELRWHRCETRMALRAEPLLKVLLVRRILATRAIIQRHDAPRATVIVAPSRVFARELISDTRVPAERILVVRNPVDLDRFRPRQDSLTREQPRPVRLVFVSRMSVRKGVQMIVTLSHLLADFEGRVTIRLIGGATLWSDYRRLLLDLNPGIAQYIGRRSPNELMSEYQAADAALQPSSYEPFGLTVAEALACGLGVVVSDTVGAAEDVDQRCCRTFPAGDVHAFERKVREYVEDLWSGKGPALRALARTEAQRLFAAGTVCARLEQALKQAAAGRFMT